jgi:hypothetical protein
MCVPQRQILCFEDRRIGFQRLHFFRYHLGLLRPLDQGPMLCFFKCLRQKKICGFDSKQKFDPNIGFWVKNANSFAENCQKSQKIVIVTLTPEYKFCFVIYALVFTSSDWVVKVIEGFARISITPNLWDPDLQLPVTVTHTQRGHELRFQDKLPCN